MPLSQRLTVTAAFLVILMSLGTADAVLTKDDQRYPLSVTAQSSSENMEDPIELPAAAVPKRKEPDVASVVASQGLTTTDASEESLIRRIIPRSTEVVTVVLLRNDDRIGMVSYAETPEVKAYFLGLKKALHESFSPAVTDLVDETRTPDGGAVANVLTFKDPAISTEKLLFVRVRQRLYEFRIAEGQDADIAELVNALLL